MRDTCGRLRDDLAREPLRAAVGSLERGHCFAGRSSSGGIVIDVPAMRSASVSSGVATVGAEVRLGEVYDSLAEHGLTIPAGRDERRGTHDS